MTKVTQYLTDHNVRFWTLHHPRAYTTAEEATVLGVEPGRLAKTLVLDTEEGHAIAVIPGGRRIDKKLLQQALGKHAKLADETEISRDFPEYELGAIPPIGSLLSVPAYVDPDVGYRENVVFAGGTQTESIEMRTRDLLADKAVKIARLTKRRPTYDEDWME